MVGEQFDTLNRTQYGTLYIFKSPVEIQLAILKQLTPRELIKMREVSRALNNIVADDSLWSPYLKSEVREEAVKAKQSLRTVFKDNLEGLTDEGLQLHPKYGPLYQSLKAEVEACSDSIDKIISLQKEGQGNPDIARIILSHDDFRTTLLQDCRGLFCVQSFIEQYDDKVMRLGWQWLFKPEVLKVFASNSIGRLDYIFFWVGFDARKSPNIAWLGLENNVFCSMLESFAIDSPTTFISYMSSFINNTRNDKLALCIFQKFMRQDTILVVLSNPTWFHVMKNMSDVLELTEGMPWPDPKVPAFTWDETIVEGIFKQMISLLEARINAQENQVTTQRPSMR